MAETAFTPEGSQGLVNANEDALSRFFNIIGRDSLGYDFQNEIAVSFQNQLECIGIAIENLGNNFGNAGSERVILHLEWSVCSRLSPCI